MPQAKSHSLHLTIDIGNTRTKLVAFANGQPIDSIALTDDQQPHGRTASAIAMESELSSGTTITVSFERVMR